MHSSSSAIVPQYKGILCGLSMDDAHGGKHNSLQVVKTLSAFLYARSPTVVLGCIADDVFFLYSPVHLAYV